MLWRYAPFTSTSSSRRRRRGRDPRLSARQKKSPQRRQALEGRQLEGGIQKTVGQTQPPTIIVRFAAGNQNRDAVSSRTRQHRGPRRHNWLAAATVLTMSAPQASAGFVGCGGSKQTVLIPAIMGNMIAVLFRCPNTGLTVQRWMDDAPDTPEDLFEWNRMSGRALGTSANRRKHKLFGECSSEARQGLQ